MKAPLAVIGGTGMNQWPGLTTVAHHRLETPWGLPSAPLQEGQIGGHPVVFLARHGEGHRLPPHAINYRANIAALAQFGVRGVVAIAAVGGIARWFPPGALALPADLIDYTWGRAHSYADGSDGASLDHVEFTAPYDAALRQSLRDSARHSGVALAGEGVLGVTQGPRLETAAEIRRMARDGCDMVGMTGMPEAALARERGLPYACLAVSVNWGAGVMGEGDIHAEIAQSIETGMAQVRRLLGDLLQRQP
ncbi:S-methyl-5'-thioinosine phosphorylase [Flagellatimonas centrodinii]|uniref:S-methyl-5'-thioinosine phosphorylase n=1 Tax=Flagellatimonas centrodinii TaxID=2806210 RepID=UPI001FEDBBB9|nr:S-methyl-5'-thioinosine phosphorylase [Flagellatimonas centrodinii]ULQ46560.1 S-methyl-5'-thioinosine phosphorylase [Flagellatimonas centrodinii]